MSICGLIIGWRIHAGVARAPSSGYLLLIAFAFAMIWVGVLLGSLVATPEGVTGHRVHRAVPGDVHRQHVRAHQHDAGASCKVIAEWNPVTTLADALRILFGNPNTPTVPSDPWSIRHPIAYTTIWIVVIVVACAPLAVRAYRRSITS